MAEPPEDRPHRRVGTMIRDKYRIDAFIATGSMAMVYAATHRNGSRVALKILHRDLARDKALAERFRREGYFANAISHPGVIRAIDDDVSEDGCAFIVMELLEGENLEERRDRLGGRIPVAQALDLADGVLDVLAAAHDHEILHRDLKPGNVFITKKEEVKLLDFGVARFNDGRSSSDMTAVGMVLGTPDFMPPEQALGRREDVDVRSDVWALGATLFRVITGKHVHTGSDAKSKLIATARSPARPIRSVMPEVSPPVAAVIDRALAFDRAARWSGAKEMREALRDARATADAKSSDSLSPPTRRIGPEPAPPTRPARREPSPFDVTVAYLDGPPLDGPASEDVVTSAPVMARREPPPAPAEPAIPVLRPSAPPHTERLLPAAPAAAPAQVAVPARPAQPAQVAVAARPAQPAPAAAPAPYPAPPPTPGHYASARPPPIAPSRPPPAASSRPAPLASSRPAPPLVTVPLTPRGAAVDPRPPTPQPSERVRPAPRRSVARVLVPIVIGALAAAGTYAAASQGLRPSMLIERLTAPAEE